MGAAAKSACATEGVPVHAPRGTAPRRTEGLGSLAPLQAEKARRGQAFVMGTGWVRKAPESPAFSGEARSVATEDSKEEEDSVAILESKP